MPAGEDDFPLDEIGRFICQTAGFDLDDYKLIPLRWWIQARMNVRRIEHFRDYDALLHADPAERDALIQGIPIRCILERKQAEESLRRSEEKFRTIIDSLDQAFCIIEMVFDDQGKPVDLICLEANPAFIRHAGHSLQGKRIKAFIPNFEQFWLDQYGHVADTGEVVRLEHTVKDLDNQWFEASAFRLGGEGSRQVAVLFANVTQRKQAEEELRRLNDTLEQRVAERTAEAERKSEQLRALANQLARAEEQERRRLAVVLHDGLQQILVAAKMRLEFLVGQAKEKPEWAQALRDIDELLDQSIKQSRSLTAELSPPILYQAGLAAGLRWLAQWFAEKHGFQVHVQTMDKRPGDIPEGTRVILFQIARELLFNAVKHSGVTSARLALERQAEQLCIIVEDQGVGFDPVLVESRHASDAGFGLFSTRERLASLGGHLDIKSTPGVGTRLTICVPVDQAAEEATGIDLAPVAERRRPGPVRPSQVIRVLLADDHRLLREGVARLLQGLGDIEVVGQAADGIEAIELARKLRPEVIVMDISMPRLGGIEATHQVTTELSGTSVIGLSMHEEDDLAAAMKAAGAVCYLRKDGPPDELIAAIRGCRNAHSGTSN